MSHSKPSYQFSFHLNLLLLISNKILMSKIILFLFSLLVLAHSEPSCRFARQYTTTQLISNATARQEYLKNVMYWEGKFHADGVGLNTASGLTYDGHSLNFTTGEIFGEPHLFSAASKECIHVGILAKIIAGDKLAQYLISEDPKVARDTAVKILTNKITSYEKFNRTYPGFGGYQPWFNVNNSGMYLLKGWEDRVPALDNGELIFSLTALIQAMKGKGLEELRTRYQNYLDLLTKYAAMIFYDGNGNVRAVTKIKNIYANPTPDNYQNENEAHLGFLNDPYEGELFQFYLVMFGGLPQKDIDLIWSRNIPNIVAIDYKTPLGNITVERGWEYSSHEKWKYLQLPYQDVPINKRIFRNGEKVRTWDSFLNKLPGMFAAINDVSTDEHIPGYIGCGIPVIATNKNVRRDVITGYSIYPLFLVEQEAITALLWYDNYLKGPKMQNLYGATEAISINGSMISSLTTWDSKQTTVLGILGGVVDLNRDWLKEKGVYDYFTKTVDSIWSKIFTTIKGEDLPFMPPSVAIPQVLKDFTTCSLNSEEEELITV